MRSINLKMAASLAGALALCSTQSMAQAVEEFDHAAHLKEHGGQIYQSTTLESKWVRNDAGDGALKSEWLTWIGSDENKLFLRGHAEKAESHDTEFALSALYSRNIADFWDVQAGVRYRYDKSLGSDKEQYDAVVGVYGMAPYYFETESYLYIGQDEQVSLSLETERDFLFTQKLITQPYLELDVLFSDESKYAKKTGLSSAALGLETRYEITKKVMPFIDVSYQYSQGKEETPWQQATSSDSTWQYAAGIRVKF